ncbi:MAG TPA: hypothetical protein VM913_03205 [Sphingomicrobium sp.]|jgi:hypothetical protein|nr:hypothetical protein [Sphingomicrobium sp.]
MGESVQFMVFRSSIELKRCSNGIANDVADLHFFLDREIEELAAARRALIAEEKIAHQALAAAYRGLAGRSRNAHKSTSATSP